MQLIKIGAHFIFYKKNTDAQPCNARAPKKSGYILQTVGGFQEFANAPRFDVVRLAPCKSNTEASWY